MIFYGGRLQLLYAEQSPEIWHKDTGRRYQAYQGAYQYSRCGQVLYMTGFGVTFGPEFVRKHFDGRIYQLCRQYHADAYPDQCPFLGLYAEVQPGGVHYENRCDMYAKIKLCAECVA